MSINLRKLIQVFYPFRPGPERLDQDNLRSPETHGDRNRPFPDDPFVQTVQKEKNQ